MQKVVCCGRPTPLSWHPNFVHFVWKNPFSAKSASLPSSFGGWCFSQKNTNPLWKKRQPLRYIMRCKMSLASKEISMQCNVEPARPRPSAFAQCDARWPTHAPAPGAPSGSPAGWPPSSPFLRPPQGRGWPPLQKKNQSGTQKISATQQLLPWRGRGDLPPFFPGAKRRIFLALKSLRKWWSPPGLKKPPMAWRRALPGTGRGCPRCFLLVFQRGKPICH